jgi:hypothetical protein
MEKKTYGIEWVVSLKLEDGTRLRGVQVAMYGHPAMAFFAKKMGVTYKSAWAEKKVHFDRFLADGFRQPLTEEELAR